MECNRDEARRAKEIAENKLSTKDITGARKFALKAQSLYPDLDGISQLLAILDVYVAAENKVNGELDFYEILGVRPSADDDTVKKHYRKLALSLHPDKNKCIGAEGAFQYVSQAWNILSDKDQRTVYDHKRNGGGFRQKVKTQNGGSQMPKPPKRNGFHHFTKNVAARTKVTTSKTKTTSNSQKDNINGKTEAVPASVPSSYNAVPASVPSSYNAAPASVPLSYNAGPTYVPSSGPNACPTSAPSSGPNTGPTSIPSCSSKQTTPKTFWTVCKRCKLQYEFFRMYLNRNLLCPTCHGPFHATEFPPPKTNGSSARNNSSKPEIFKTTGADMGHGTGSQWGSFTKTANPGDAAQAASMGQQSYDRVKRGRETAQAATKREEALRRKISKKEAKSVNMEEDVKGFGPFSVNNEPNEVKKDVHSTGFKNRLINKATMEIKKKLNEWSSETLEDNSVGYVDVANGDLKNHEPDPLVSEVPDPDFHDFDCERSEKCFKEGQVWAAYDDHDGMPRLYAMIRKVISLNPFKMKVCWLNSKPDNNRGPFPGSLKAFGEFKPGKHGTVSAPNYFSHKACFKKQANGSICIFPRKGDVWALYRNDQMSGLVKHIYEMVVVDEYDEETGIIVTPLVKVSGYKTVFHRHLNPKETRLVLEDGSLWFSHQIPSSLVTGQESADAPKGCIELDPAAVPPEFLQVTDKADEAEKVDVKDGEMLVEDGVLEDFKEVGSMENGGECSKC